MQKEKKIVNWMKLKLILWGKAPGRSEHLIEENDKSHGNSRLDFGLHYQPKHVGTQRHSSDGLFFLDLRHAPPLPVVHRACSLRVRPLNLVQHVLVVWRWRWRSVSAVTADVCQTLVGKDVDVFLHGESRIHVRFLSVVHHPVVSKAQPLNDHT